MHKFIEASKAFRQRTLLTNKLTQLPSRVAYILLVRLIGPFPALSRGNHVNQAPGGVHICCHTSIPCGNGLLPHLREISPVPEDKRPYRLRLSALHRRAHVKRRSAVVPERERPYILPTNFCTESCSPAQHAPELPFITP